MAAGFSGGVLRGAARGKTMQGCVGVRGVEFEVRSRGAALCGGGGGRILVAGNWSGGRSRGGEVFGCKWRGNQGGRGGGSIRVGCRDRRFSCVASARSSGSARHGEVEKQEKVAEDCECGNGELTKASTSTNGRSPDVEDSIPGRVVCDLGLLLVMNLHQCGETIFHFSI